MTTKKHKTSQAQVAEPTDWALRCAGRLRALAPDRVWRDLLAFVLALLTYVAAEPLLFYIPIVQLGVACAVVAGLTADGERDAAMAAGAAFMAGWAIHLPFVWNLSAPAPLLWQVLLVALGAAAVAAGVQRVSARRGVARGVLTWLVVGLFVANMWTTAYTVDGISSYDVHMKAQIPSTWEQLRGNLPASFEHTDNAFYLRILQDMRAGKSFYASDSGELRAAGFPVSHVFNFRLPTLFWVWSALPDPTWIVPFFLVLASLAVFVVPAIHTGDVPLPAVVVGCAALASYLVYFAVQLLIVTVEPWAGAIAVLSFAALATSYRAKRWAAWVSAAVALAVLSAAVRELMVPVLIAGLASSAWPSGQRRFRLTAWSVGLAAFCVCYAAHSLRVQQYLSASGGAMRSASLLDAARAIVFGSLLADRAPWVPFVLAGLGVLGAVAIARREPRTFAALAVILPLVVFALVTNDAHGFGSTRVNYWGAIVDPLILALLPAAFRLLPFGASTASSFNHRRGHA